MQTTTALMITSLCCAACTSPYRRVTLGTGHATPGQAGGPTSPTAVRVDNPGDLHEIRIEVALPRAVELDYEVRCPGGTRIGVIGETWERYRHRRLAELRRQRARKTAAVSAVTGAVIGDVSAAGTVSTPTGEGRVEAGVDGTAVGGLVAEQIVPRESMQAGDLGGRLATRTLQIRPSEAGSCRLHLSHRHQPDDLIGVRGTFTVTRLANRSKEKWAAKRQASAQAIKVRASLRASLIARGADPTKRARERAARQARLDADRRQRLVLELRAKRRRRAAQARRARQLRLEANIGIATRGRIVRWLGECGGDPYKRQRERVAIARQREADRIARFRARRVRDRDRRRRRAHRNALIGVALDLRGKLRGQLIDAGADPEYRWKLYQAAAATQPRAPVRPAMPATPVEVRPAAPHDGAVWIAGSFAWRGLRWVWQPGRWTARATVRDHRSQPPRVHPRPHVPRPPRPRIRDHRTAQPPAPPRAGVRRPAARPAPRVRDHRRRADKNNKKNSSPTSRTRDHR